MSYFFISSLEQIPIKPSVLLNFWGFSPYIVTLEWPSITRYFLLLQVIKIIGGNKLYFKKFNPLRYGLLETSYILVPAIIFFAASFGFDVLFGGSRMYGNFAGVGKSPYVDKGSYECFWTSTPYMQNDSTELAITRGFSVFSNGILRGTSDKTAAYHVRCVKDAN